MSKNTHLEHLEDSILLDGQQGITDAFAFLDLLAKTFSTKSTGNFKITTKWDGAPAIFCGTYPGTGQFFVGTKSIFNKDAKINFSDADIDTNHGHAPGLVKKLKSALKYLPSLGITGVAQGDLLFTDDKRIQTIDGVRSLTFKPNTIMYSIPHDSNDFNQANNAKIGVVFHTTYTGNTISTMSATFGYDVSKLKDNRDVFVISAELDTLGTNMLLTQTEKQKLSRLKTSSSSMVRDTSDFLNTIRDQIANKDALTVGPKLKQYFNKYVRVGKKVDTNFTSNFRKYFSQECKKAADAVKQPKTKAAKLKKLYDGENFLDDNAKSFEKVVSLYKTIQDAKEIFIEKLQQGEKFGTYLITDDGIEMTNPEGYVAIANGTKAFKLVDRLGFSQANFKKDAVADRWVKG